MKESKKLPWYTVSLLISVLGAVSIILLFGVRYYNEHGIVFWTIILAWACVLIGSTTEISRLERERKLMTLEKDGEISKLKEEISELKK